jgi:Holliday junction DNA helicase RuvA
VIVSLEGTLVEISALSAVIEVGGVGYLVNIPLSVSCKLPAIGSGVKLRIHAIYREDRQDLYGFLTVAERDFFKLIVEKVSGIGPKTALNVMSKLSLPALMEAISTGNADVLAKCHGVGRKSAERIIVELSDKNISALAAKPLSMGGLVAMNSNTIGDSVAALVSLGYRAADAEKAVRKAISTIGEAATAEEIIRAALNS